MTCATKMSPALPLPTTPDLAVDPPPDLAIEIDISAPEFEKASVYARLGVPEIWRWRHGRLAVLERQSLGGYTERQTSVALPDFPLNELAAALAAYPEIDSARSVALFRKSVRDKIAKT
jgi:Uma2 family endonuclease